MNEESSKTEEAREGPLGGERLRAARRANDISVRDVAKELHIDEAKVRALEKNEFDVLGAPVFAKGHLRKYAELVGVPVEDVMTDYYQMNRASGAPPVVGPKRNHPRDINLAPWIGSGLVGIIVIAAAYWWFVLRTPAPGVSVEPARPAPLAAETVRQQPAAEPPGAPAAGEVSGGEPVDTAGDPAPATSTAETPAATADYEPTPGAPQVEMVLAFTGECWTEVTDASGRRLFYDLGSEGRVVTLSGDAPLRVILGDSENVSITVDGRDWPVPASARRGRLARLTITPR